MDFLFSKKILSYTVCLFPTQVRDQNLRRITVYLYVADLKLYTASFLICPKSSTQDLKASACAMAPYSGGSTQSQVEVGSEDIEP